MSTSTSVYWYWVLEIRAPIVMSCAACIYNVMPQTGCSALFKRAITWSTPTLWLIGFNVMNTRPSFSVTVGPPGPI